MIKKIDFKIILLINVVLIYFLLCIQAYADSFVKLGNDQAKVKIKIFSSLTCPYCASFHKNVVPKIEKEYVNNGIVQLIFMDFPLDHAALNASKLINCVSADKQIKLLDIIYEKQNEWASASDIDEINNNLEKMFKKLGINISNFDKCLNNEDIENKILNGRIEAQKKYSINATPTIIINEEKFKKELNFKNIKKIIDKII
tara:strand:+ start:275 stop:877 length:603 start_codon:yes stop_codon:yes gene_type:complete